MIKIEKEERKNSFIFNKDELPFSLECDLDYDELIRKNSNEKSKIQLLFLDKYGFNILDLKVRPLSGINNANTILIMCRAKEKPKDELDFLILDKKDILNSAIQPDVIKENFTKKYSQYRFMYNYLYGILITSDGNLVFPKKANNKSGCVVFDLPAIVKEQRNRLEVSEKNLELEFKVLLRCSLKSICYANKDYRIVEAEKNTLGFSMKEYVNKYVKSEVKDDYFKVKWKEIDQKEFIKEKCKYLYTYRIILLPFSSEMLNQEKSIIVSLEDFCEYLQDIKTIIKDADLSENDKVSDIADIYVLLNFAQQLDFTMLQYWIELAKTNYRRIITQNQDESER